MSSLRQNIPHVQQPADSAWCGAACLKMIYDFYHISSSLEAIWDAVKGQDDRTGNTNCRLYLMGKHAKSKKLNACAISTKDPIPVFHKCIESGIHMIPLFRSDLTSNSAHFVVVTGYENGLVFFNDPLDDESNGKDKVLPYIDWMLRAQPTATTELVKPNTMLLIGSPLIKVDRLPGLHDPKIGIESVEVFSAIRQLGLDINVLCLEHDRWF